MVLQYTRTHTQACTHASTLVKKNHIPAVTASITVPAQPFLTLSPPILQPLAHFPGPRPSSVTELMTPVCSVIIK